MGKEDSWEAAEGIQRGPRSERGSEPEHFRYLAEQSPNMIFINKEGRVRYANEKCSAVMGYSREEFYAEGFDFMSLIAPESSALIRRNYERHHRGENVEPYEYELVTRKGDRLSAIITTSLIDYDGGKAILGIVTDITDRRNAENALRETLELNEKILSSSTLGIAAYNSEGDCVLANDIIGSILGATREQVLSQNIWKIESWRVSGLIDDAKKVMAEDSQATREIRVHSTFGRDVWLECRLGRFSMQGRPHLLLIIDDIKQRKRVEEALRESEEKFRLAFETARDAIIWIDPGTGSLLNCNKAAEALLERSREDILGLHHTDLHSGVRSEYYSGMMKDNIASGGLLNEEAEIVTGRGRLKTVHVSASMMRMGNRDVMQGIFCDITERKKMEDELRNNLGKLRRILKGTVNGLALMAEKRDPYTAGHQQRVSRFADAMAREMGLAEDQVEGVRTAALLHDIGKISIPAEIITKPARLTDTEFAIIETHCRVGHSILSQIEFPWPVAEIVLQHHERIDGSGYPCGLSEENILMEAKILAVSDVVEAMSSYRPYRPAPGTNKALEEISRNRGILYDRKVADVCLKLFTEKGFSF